jgi:hypothetical protein
MLNHFSLIGYLFKTTLLPIFSPAGSHEVDWRSDLEAQLIHVEQGTYNYGKVCGKTSSAGIRIVE